MINVAVQYICFGSFVKTMTSMRFVLKQAGWWHYRWPKLRSNTRSSIDKSPISCSIALLLAF
jgi:hypothetical protein